MRTRLFGGFGMLIAIASVVIGIAIWSADRQQAANEHVSQRAVPYLTSLSEAALAAKAAANDERGFLLKGKSSYADEARGRRTVEKDGLTKARAASMNEQQAKAVDAIQAGLDAFNQALDREFAADPATASAMSDQNRTLRKAYEERFDQAINQAKQSVAAESVASGRRAAETRTMLLGLLAAMIAIGGVAATWLVRAMMRPLSAEIIAIEAAAQGDLTVRVPDSGVREFQRMATATNEMLTATERAIATIAQAAETVGTTAGQLAAASAEIAGATGGAAEEAGSVSAAAEQISANVQTVAAAAEQVGTTITGISDSAHSAAQVATEAVQAADGAKATVSKLDESSLQIGNVVKTITAIAEQTNLLALNATIEAARAGESGKGFAVVASEVKDLAQETARATEDIARQVETIQTDTRQATDAIARISDIIQVTNEHQGNIASTVEEQSAATQEMNRNISEAAIGAGSIAESIGNVAGLIQGTTAETEQARQASAGLAEMGTRLRELVSRFTYGDVTP